MKYRMLKKGEMLICGDEFIDEFPLGHFRWLPSNRHKMTSMNSDRYMHGDDIGYYRRPLKEEGIIL